MADLFDPLTLRGTTVRNRAWVSPMCQYSAVAGVPDDWHLVHLGSRAVGGAGLVMTEATAVSPEGRISPADTGLWNDAQAAAWERVTRFVRGHGAVAGVQLAHAGRKASTTPPWQARSVVAPADGGWEPLAPSATAFEGLAEPRAMDATDVAQVVVDFAAAAQRALAAGFQLVELHAAHGYLLHEFLSPLTNKRDDAYGGDAAGRTRLLLEVVDAVRAVWPDRSPLLVRVSATDWVEGGWGIEDTVALAEALAGRGVDLVDCSSGGIAAGVTVPVGPGYQVPFAAEVRRRTGVPTAAVGLITTAAQAQAVVAAGDADAVMLARASLREPMWPLLAAHELGAGVTWPEQYERARPR